MFNEYLPVELFNEYPVELFNEYLPVELFNEYLPVELECLMSIFQLNW